MHDDEIELIEFHLRTAFRLCHKMYEDGNEDALKYALCEGQHDAETDEEYAVWEALIHMKQEPFDE